MIVNIFVVFFIRLSWKERIVPVFAPKMAVYHLPGHPEQGFYRRPTASSQLARKGGRRIEICQNECDSSVGWSPHNFKQDSILANPVGGNGVVKWVLTLDENGMLETGTTADTMNRIQRLKINSCTKI